MHPEMWPLVLEDVLFGLALLILLETVLLVWRTRGWERVGWAVLATGVWGYIAFGEAWVQMTDSSFFIWRWTRAIPARIGTAIAFGIFLWLRWRR